MSDEIRHRKRRWKKTVVTVLLVAAAAGGACWYFFARNKTAAAPARLAVAEVTSGSLVVTVDGSGQIISEDEAEIRPEVSGTLLSVKVKVGDKVAAGQIVATIDSSDAQTNVRDAQNSLETAQLGLDKVKAPPTELEIMKAENSVTDAEEAVTSAHETIIEMTEDGYDEVSSAFLDLPDVVSGLNDLLFTVEAGTNNSQWNIDYYSDTARRYDEKVVSFRDDADGSFRKAKASFDAVYAAFKSSSRDQDAAVTVNLIGDTHEAVLLLDEALKDTTNFIQYYEDTLTARGYVPATMADRHLASLSGWMRTNSAILSGLKQSLAAMENSQDKLTAAARSVVEKKASLADLTSGPDALDVRSQNLTIEQREEALAEAKRALADYVVRSPIAGTVASVDASRGDKASSGTSVATVIADTQVAEVSLTEIDAAKVKVGMKATMTFDAVSDIELSGRVAELSPLGTVSQGVVTYTAKVAMDVQDDRVKPAMSVTASIITAASTDALLVPAAAVKKATDGTSYVEVIDTPAATDESGAVVAGLVSGRQRVTVTTGLVNDEYVEIKSGLEAGQTVVIREIKADVSSAATTATRNGSGSIFGGMMGGGPR
jgi:HlyD family secretion protein